MTRAPPEGPGPGHLPQPKSSRRRGSESEFLGSESLRLRLESMAANRDSDVPATVT